MAQLRSEVDAATEARKATAAQLAALEEKRLAAEAAAAEFEAKVNARRSK